MSLEELRRALPDTVHFVLANCDSLTVYALHPDLFAEPPARFQGYAVQGAVRVEEAQARREIVVALYQAMADDGARAAMCFEPHHGVRATWGEREIDFVLCARCDKLQLFLNGQHLGWWWPIGGTWYWLLDDLLKHGAST